MDATAIRLDELLRAADGRVDLQGRRLSLLPADAIALLCRDVARSAGPALAARILQRTGWICGFGDAELIARTYGDGSDPAGLLAACLELVGRLGWGQAALRGDTSPTNSRQWNVSVRNSLEAEPDDGSDAAADIDAAPGRCHLLAGYLGGLASRATGQNVRFEETGCRGANGRVCQFVGRAMAEEDSAPTALPFDQAGAMRRRVDQWLRRHEADNRSHLPAAPKQAADRSAIIAAYSEAGRRVLDFASRIAPYNSSVLITGESGVGKEVLARFMHGLSPRGKADFLAVNCAALPETLLESELFGHKAGAFTGAISDRVGLFEQARGGTIFLDEIGDITPAMQLKLLRVLQEKEIMRVGESQPRKVDVRVIAATNRDLGRAVRDQKFREDLYYRLGVIELEVPPLRHRREDVLPLARFFVERLTDELAIPNLQLDASTIGILQSYAWPGNVRELENAIERAAVLCRDGRIMPSDLPPAIARSQPSTVAIEDPLERSLADVEHEHIRKVLEATANNRTRAARVLGISPATLWRKLKKR